VHGRVVVQIPHASPRRVEARELDGGIQRGTNARGGSTLSRMGTARWREAGEGKEAGGEDCARDHESHANMTSYGVKRRARTATLMNAQPL
jgi:hypothetical protein